MNKSVALFCIALVKLQEFCEHLPKNVEKVDFLRTLVDSTFFEEIKTVNLESYDEDTLDLCIDFRNSLPVVDFSLEEERFLYETYKKIIK